MLAGIAEQKGFHLQYISCVFIYCIRSTVSVVVQWISEVRMTYGPVFLDFINHLMCETHNAASG